MDRYSDIIRLLATKNNLPLVDLREKFISYSRANNPNNDSKGILTTDGVHLNEKGNGLVAAEMWKAIKSL
jgi:lysophospholipase L1-like esterase